MRQSTTAKKSRLDRILKVRQIVAPISYIALKATPPSFSTRSKLTTSQARGKTYERKVIHEISRLLKAGELPASSVTLFGPWINYSDANGPGLAQPDIVILTDTACLILEVKLKESPRALLQLEGLYGPLCRALWPRPTTLLLQVFKFPTLDKTPHLVDDPMIFLANPAPGVHHWHYIP